MSGSNGGTYGGGIKSGANILDAIAEKTRGRVDAAKKNASFDVTRDAALELFKNERASGLLPTPRPFEKALAAPGLSFICEVKKASPSKGLIAEDFPYLEIGREYEAAGAAAISVLTEPNYFLGNDRYLKEIAGEVTIPVLRKDFVIDPYQIYEAKLLGASAVLLIVALLDKKELAHFAACAAEAGLSALVEIHDEAEAEMALEAGAGIIGINNRDLKTFNVDLGVTERLRKLLPAGVLTVGESGVKNADDVRALLDAGVDAALVGESMMRAPDKKAFLAELKAVGG